MVDGWFPALLKRGSDAIVETVTKGPSMLVETVANSVSVDLRKQTFQTVEQATGNVELATLLRQAAAGDPPVCDLSAHHQVITLASAKKSELIASLAQAKCGASKEAGSNVGCCSDSKVVRQDRVRSVLRQSC